MPMLSWDPVEFLDVLGVIPEIAEYGTSYHYDVIRPNLRLVLTVWPLNADVAISLYSSHQPEPVIHINLLNCPLARVVQDKRGKFIEFSVADLFSGRFEGVAATPYGFRLWIDPYLQVEPYTYSW